MVNHTLSRILILSEDSLKLLSSCNAQQFNGTFYLKTGFDGASSQSIYKQRYVDTDLSEAKQNEESIFQTGIVPLRLTIADNIIWSNQKTSSSHFCRPLHLQ